MPSSFQATDISVSNAAAAGIELAYRDDLASIQSKARTYALIQDALNADRNQLHSGRLGHEARISVGHHYETYGGKLVSSTMKYDALLKIMRMVI